MFCFGGQTVSALSHILPIHLRRQEATVKLATISLAIANRSRVSCAHRVTAEMTFKGHLKSPEVSRFDRASMISYYRSMVTMALSCIISHISIIGVVAQW